MARSFLCKKANPFNPTILWGFLIYKNKKHTFFDRKDAIFVTFYIGARKRDIINKNVEVWHLHQTKNEKEMKLNGV